MTPEQKQQAKQLIADWTKVSKTSTPAVWFLNGDCMAGFLQELVDAPEEPEPFGYFKVEPFGWTDCAETDDGAIALFAAPPAPSVPDGWKLVPYTPTVQMLERAAYAVNSRPQPSKYEPSATPAIIFWTAMLNYAPEAP